MALESATYISGLNSSNPTTGDQKTEGDDHIRLIKATVLATFPNVTAAVTPTHTELNYVDGVTSALQTQLDAKLGNANWTFNTNRLSNSGNTQPRFSAHTSGDLTAAGTEFSAYTEDFDTGSNFNATTGIFVAPITGLYLFTLQYQFTYSTGTAEVAVQIADAVNGTCTAYGRSSHTAGSIYIFTLSTLMSLAATNTVWAGTGAQGATGTVGGVHAARFSGCLLY